MTSKMSEKNPTAKVKQVNGRLVLEDSTACNFVIAKHNCLKTFEVNIDRINHFVTRLSDLKKTPQNTVIVIINVDDNIGKALAEALMPGFNWQPIRDRGEVPIARGLADRQGMSDAINLFDADAAAKLRSNPDTLCVIIVQEGVAEIFNICGHPLEIL